MDVSIQQLYQAYMRCHKGKAKTAKAQQYSARLLDNLYEMQRALQSYAYKAKPVSCFVATNGSKPREIHAADFSDRVMHHFLVPKLEAIISQKFIYYSCANQKGKGTHFGVKALQKMMRLAAEKQSDVHYLQLDIHNFFYSIDKEILLAILARHIKQAIKKQTITREQGRDYYRLCREILKRGKQANHLTIEQRRAIPAHKQLCNIVENKGLPIGNLSSQFFGNVIMNELDQFVKHHLKVTYYVRFVDDFVLLGSQQQLKNWQQAIENYLHQQLALRLKDDIKLKPISAGADFLGYIIYPHYLLLRKRVLVNFYKQLKSWQQQYIDHGKITLHKASTEQLQSSVASYLGHINHAKSHQLMSKLRQHFSWFDILFSINKAQTPWQYQLKTKAKQATRLSQQWTYFKQSFQGFIVIMQKGSCWLVETHTIKQLPPAVQSYCQHKPQTKLVENTVFEVSLSYLKNSLKQLEKQACAYVLITEQGYVHNRLKQRVLQRVFLA